MTELPAQRSLQPVVIRAGDAGYLIRVKRREVLSGIEWQRTRFRPIVEKSTLNGFLLRACSRRIVAEEWVRDTAICPQLCHQRRNRSIAVNHPEQAVSCVAHVVDLEGEMPRQLTLDAKVPLLYVGNVEVGIDRSRKRKSALVPARNPEAAAFLGDRY